MLTTPQTSLSVLNQLPDFIKEENPLFESFLQAYYGSQERVGGSVGILNNLTNYFNLSKYDLKKINGSTNTIGTILSTSRNIEVESTDSFPEENGTILINDEVIYYESIRKAPNVVLTPDISYGEFLKKQILLSNPYQQFDGTRFIFDLKANNEPIYPPSAKHLLIRVYNEYLIPDVDYIVVGSTIRFTTPPRAFDPIILGDSSGDISFIFLKGFQESTIQAFDNIGTIDTSIDPEKYDFDLKINNVEFKPASVSLIIAIVDGVLLTPLVDYSIYGSKIILSNFPTESAYIAFINAPLLTVGAGCNAVSVVNDSGQIQNILVKNGGSGYRIENTPKVSLVKSTGTDATAKALVSGIKSLKIIDSGKGYSQSNPPKLFIQPPTNTSGSQAKGFVTVNSDGHVESITITNSGSGYDFIPRIQFINPTGAVIGNLIVNPDNGSIQSVDVISGGSGYTVAPEIYIDNPIDEAGIKCLLRANLNSLGEVESVSILTGGRGYSISNPPRVSIIQPTNAQILSVDVDSFGRVVNIDLLSGGFGYEDVPSVYIVDDRVDNLGNPIGGSGAKAVATIFNGAIIDINITDFGEGYSVEYPPKIFISSPTGAKASCSVGEGEITGFEIISPGKNYTKSEFVACSRGVSGIIGYDADDNALYKSEKDSIPSSHIHGSSVIGLDAVFFKKILERLAKQYLPSLPDIDVTSVNITNVIRTVKDFYASKGTKESISYLFKVLYGVNIDIDYPKDQIIKPSASVWSVDTILRAKLISGNPENLRDSSIIQKADLVDTNVQYASATIENFIAIQTSSYDVYELVLSEESIVGKFTIPYKTKLAEPLDSESSIITVDSTIGWPERNGQIVVGTELIRYKEKSLTQFIECTRGINQTPSQWDSATEVTSNFYIVSNEGTDQEVVLLVLGIVESGNTNLVEQSSYYLPGDKLTVAKLGATESSSLITSWLYNVKKLVQIQSITYGGLNNQTATVTCTNPHGLLVGDQVTIYGANPIVYNGSFLVSSRESALVFKYELPQPATLNPQGNILISVDLNKGKSDVTSINSAIKNFATNVQNTFFNTEYVYVAASGIPNYKIGPFLGTSLLPGNQRKLYRFPKSPQTISLKPETIYGSVGSFINGISVWNFKSDKTYKYGPVTKVNISNSGTDYDAGSPPVLSFEGGNGSGAKGSVIVNGSVTEIEVLSPGSGYTSSPLVSISGGGGDGASATAIITKGIVSRILVNTPGSGFTSNPIITITGGGGTGATARAYVRGPIKEVVIEDGGQDYTSNPTVTLSSGSGAAAQAYVSNGRIVSIAVIASGNGYTTAPKVVITGDGYGAIAVANIQTEGAEAGKVTSISILNRGIGYKQGTTQIRLESIGEGAVFKTEIFEWTFNLQETTNFDYANGSIFEGFNTQYGGEYGHVSNPKQLRYVLGDNLTVSNGEIIEKETGIVHSPILGWAFDGNPIYGPYGLSDPTNLASTILPIKSSYVLKSNLIFDPTTNPFPIRISGPSLNDYPAGTFIQDYEYQFRSEQYYLDEYNGRFCKTPDFPEGTYAYFITLDSAGNPSFPYIIGPRFYSIPDSWNLSQFAVQSNIPTGIVRYRAPFENVDVDIERSPNESTNALTLENGEILTFEVEDENRDGIIDESEQTDPDQIFEEAKLQLFDYFPKIDVSSKVDIEVETTTKFEDAKISGFLIENPGTNYQVGDRLIFDDSGTEGYGASASVDEITGETVTSYTYTYSSEQNEYYGIVQTAVPHNMIVGDIVNVKTTPLMEPSSKTIYVRTIHGLENVNISVSGLGYDPTIPIEAVIDSETGSDAAVEPLVGITGSLDKIKIINSGRGYTENPKIRISHPQIQKRALYYALSKSYQGDVKILNFHTDETKNLYIVGSVKSTNGDTHGFISKLNSEGNTLWAKSLTSVQPGSTKRCEILGIVKNNNSVYIVGQTYPNTPSAANFNPDILIARYNENTSGTYATLSWQKELAGISGVLRNDYVTGIALLNDNLIISGYTTTNATGINDATLLYVSPQGDILHKRKITSTSSGEKFHSVKVDSNGFIYVAGQVTPSNDLLVCKLQIQNNKIVTIWQKKLSYSNNQFFDITLMIDEYDEIYISSSLLNVSTLTQTKLCLIKLNSSGELKLQKEYGVPGLSSLTGSISSIDIFNDINLGYYGVTSEQKEISGILKLNYRGEISNSYSIQGSKSVSAFGICSDLSGDPILLGSTSSNRTQFLFDGEDYVDNVGNVSNIVPTSVTTTSDSKWGTNAYSVALSGKLSATTTLTTSSWTVEGWFKYDTAPTTKTHNILTVSDGTDTLKIEIQGSNSSPTTYGKIRTEVNGTASSWSTASNIISSMSGSYAHIAVTKSFANSVATYTIYLNGTQVLQSTSSANIDPSTIDFGTTTTINSVAMKVDDLRLSNYAISYTTAPTNAFYPFDYGTESGFIMKFDKNADSVRMGSITLTQNNSSISRTALSITPSTLTLVNEPYTLGADGLQILDYNDATSYLTQDYHIPTDVYDTWSSRTATVPSPGGRKAQFETSAFGKFFFRHFTVEKFDNIRALNINQSFTFNIGKIINQKNSIGATIASAKIIDIDSTNNILYVTDQSGSFTTNSGYLESSDLVANEIKNYVFEYITATTPGTFNASITGGVEATFKNYSDDDYLIRIDEIIPGSSYARGSVVTLSSSNFSFNTARTSVTITGLSSVTKISLITNLKKTLQVDSIDKTNRLFVRTTTSHYLSVGDNIYTETAPQYSYADGSFFVSDILSKKEFIFSINSVPGSFVGSSTNLYVYVKHPVFKFIYGQQYTFDVTHVSNEGYYLSFYRDNLNKIEYTFKNIVRKGIPGRDAPGASPFISFKITDDVSNISYYADPSRLGDISPVAKSSYIDVVKSPYIGNFEITEILGGTVTLGANRFKFKLNNDPEKNAQAFTTSYSTKSTKVAGSIASIRLINGGGFYKKLPVISDIQSVRKIERVEINNPGTEYEPGEYFGVPILGNGAGGKVRIVVDGNTDPAGQIVEVVVTDPGKGYTEAYIDVDAIDGILGPTLAGSGAVLEVIIPPKGTGASIFVKGESVGKIKKLKNNNFGFNYTHDYTLRPEISFPVNLQLTNTSILSSIKVTNPGSGYTSIPEVVIVGGGGTGAIATAEVRNGRISAIIIKNPGFGYSTAPSVELKTSFTYVVNLDLGLFQMAYPHGITNGSEITFTAEDLGQGAILPLTSFGYIIPGQIYYAIAGSGAGLETNQLRVALTPQDAESGNYISFANAGTGRQILLTNSFGGSAEAVVETGRFLAGEMVYQGESLETASAIGYVSENDGWQIGPRILKLINNNNPFSVDQKVTGVISKASGTIDNINAAKGVIGVDSITRTPGKFLNDVGKTNEIVQKIQDSYLYQSFSYNIKSPLSIDQWKKTVVENAHASGFKIFGEISVSEDKKGLTDKTDFELTKSVNLIESSVVSNIDNFGLVEPVYKEFDNTQVLFRTNRLTSSEEILTSYVQKIDNISNLFDGERTSFPLTIDGATVIANTNQLQIVLNGISQAPGQSFEVQQGSIVFKEAPPAPTKVSYAVLTLQFLPSYQFNINNVSGILPELGGNIVGLSSNARATVLSSTTSSLRVFNIVGTFIPGELILSSATGLSATFVSQVTLTNSNTFEFKERITNLNGKTADVEAINLDNQIVTNQITISKTSGTYQSPSGLLSININDFITSAKTGIIAKVISVSPYIDPETGAPVSSISISDPSSFFGLLYNRIIQPEYPNVIIDDISKSSVSVVDIDDSSIKVESRFPEFETINTTTFENYSRSAKTIVTNGNAQRSTTQSKFGGGSVYLDGTGDYLSILDNTAFDISSNYTIESWIYLPSLPSGAYSMLFGLTGINWYWGIRNNGGTLYLTHYDGASVLEQSSGTTLTTGVWAHVAWSKTGTTLRAFLNGTQVFSGTSSTSTTDANGLNIGYAFTYVNQYQFNGYLDEIRVSNIARYTSNFNIPTSAFVNDPQTILLIHGNTVSIVDDGGSDQTIIEEDFIQNLKISYINSTGDYALGETVKVNKLAYKGLTGGSFQAGDIVKTSGGFSAPIIGVNYALKYLFLGEQTGTFSLGNTISCDKSFVTDNDIVAGRYADASNLILANKLLIADVAVGRMLSNFPGFTVPGGNQNCKDDIVDVLEEICFNLKYGGNHRAYDVGLLYINNNYLLGERDESVYAFNQARNMAIQAMRNETITLGGYTSLTQYKDLTVEGDISGQPGIYQTGDCANVASALTTLFGIVTQAIGSDATPGNLTGITRTNIGTVSAVISAYLEIPFNIEQINTATNKITTYQYFDDTQHRFRDAANLIRLNATYIIEETVGRMKNKYADLIIPGDETGGTDGTSRCKLDLSLLLDAVVTDIEYGGNYNTLSAGRFYLDENGGVRYITLQILQSIYAHQQMSLLCQQAVEGTLPEDGTYTNELPINPLGITVDPGNCANVKSQINTLWTLINTVISTTGDVYKDAGNLLWFNRKFISDESVGKTTSYFTYFLNGISFKAFEYPNGTNGEEKCKRDIKQYIIPSIIADLISGGDANTIAAMTYYLDGTDVTSVKDELLPTIYALQQANTLCQLAVGNWITTGTTLYTPQFASVSDRYRDTSITADNGTYGGNCATIKSAIDTLFTKAITILLPNRPNGFSSSTVYSNAAKLILFNKNYFKEEIVGATQAQYPTFNFGASSSSGAQAFKTKCKRDIGYIVDAIVYDLLTYGNSAIYTATQSYIDAATGTIISLQGELVQSIYAYNLLKTYLKNAVAKTLTSPSPYTTYYSYTESGITFTSAQLTELNAFIDNRMSILLGTLNNSTYLETNSIVPFNAITVPAKTYPTRIDSTGISGKLISGDYIFGNTSKVYGEIESIETNTAVIKKVLKRIRINFNDNTEKFSENNIVSKQGAASNNGKVFAYSYSENFNYIDVDMNSGSFAVGDTLINGDGYTATVVSIVDKYQISNLVGSFINNDFVKQFSSNSVVTILNYQNTSSPVLDNTGSKLTLDTESYFGNFNISEVVYTNRSELYIDTNYNLGTQVTLGDVVQTKEIYKLQVSLSTTNNSFPVGYTINDSSILSNTAVIIGFIPNNPQNPTTAEIYVGNLGGDFFSVGNQILCYEPGNNFPIGVADVTNATIIQSEAYGFVEKIESVGIGFRLYLSGVKGTFNQYAQVLSRFGYKSLISEVNYIVGRIQRSFRGFDGQQTTFDLTILNGTQYLPNPDGHLLVFVNGILQPPEQSYSTYSNIIEFTEPPVIGSSFNSVYIGKLRKLDDIGFEFDSLRNSFNLKLNEVFYSLTVTAGAESSNIKPENNLIVSLNGVIQEPGVAFELVGSRIIFAEVPRAGSSFVAFSYIGSDADVIAAQVVPPIESGDELSIEGEDGDRTVAIIESSNSLVTFDYTGSVFGRNASALVNLISGRISKLSITSPGSGYVSRPTVSLDSSTGFDGQIKALVGLSRIDVVNRGSGYAYPIVEVINEVIDIPGSIIFDSSTTLFDSTTTRFDQS